MLERWLAVFLESWALTRLWSARIATFLLLSVVGSDSGLGFGEACGRAVPYFADSARKRRFRSVLLQRRDLRACSRSS